MSNKFKHKKPAPPRLLALIGTRVIERISTIQSTISSLKSRIVQRLGVECLFPRIIQPFEPIFKYVRCKFGIKDDDFMATPTSCNATSCLDPHIKEQTITRDLGVFPNLDDRMKGKVTTMDDCFGSMKKVNYGVRVLVTLIDDKDCDDSKYAEMCKKAMEEDRIVMEENCQTKGYF